MINATEAKKQTLNAQINLATQKRKALMPWLDAMLNKAEIEIIQSSKLGCNYAVIDIDPYHFNSEYPNIFLTAEELSNSLVETLEKEHGFKCIMMASRKRVKITW